MQLPRIVRRITENRPGLKEEETLRIMQAFVVSRLAYTLPFHCLNKQETDQASVILRTAYKAALGLRNYTANEKLMSLGVSNTFEEIREALLISQKQRLQKTKADKAILQRVGSPTNVHLIIHKVEMSGQVPTRLKGSPT